MKILLLSLQYPFTIASYFIKALRNREDVELKLIGPDYGNWIPWKGGMKLKPEYAPLADFPLQMFKGRMPCAIPPMFVQNLGWEPDLILNIDAGCYLTGHPGIPYYVVATDAHVLRYDLQRGIADRFYNMHHRYSKPGDIDLPYAYSPDWHYPEEVEKKYDVCMLGLQYQHRIKVEKLLDQAGISSYFDVGEVYDEYRKAYCAARVGLNWASMDDLNARHFELLAMGIPSVQYRTTDADLFFEAGKDYLAFKTAQQAVTQIKYLLANKEAADAMVKSGLKAVAPHTYDARVDQIIKDYNGSL